MRCTQGQYVSPASSKTKLRRGLWSPEEDEKLVTYLMKRVTPGCSWTYVAKQAGLQRCGKSCRLRWINYLRPGIKRGPFSSHEEQLIIDLHSIMGNRWSQMAGSLPGRTDNEIKNYWNTCIKKKLKHLCGFSTKSNIASKSNLTSNSNSALSTHAQNAFTLPQSAQPYLGGMPENAQNAFTLPQSAQPYLGGMPEIFQLEPPNKNVNPEVPNTAESHYSCVDSDVLGFTKHCVQGVDQNQFSSNPESTNYNRLISNSQMWINSSSTGAHYEISNSLEEKGKNDVDMVGNDNENEILLTCSSFTGSSVIIAGSTNPYSDAADFTDVSLAASTTQEAGFSFLKDHLKDLHKKSNYHQSYPAHNSRSQYSKAGIIWADVDQFCNVHAQADQDDYKDPVNSRYDEINVGVPMNFNIQLPNVGGVQIGDQWNSTSIPTQKAKATQTPTVLGTGGSEPLELGCQGAASQTVWPHDDPMYNFHTDSSAHQIYFS